MARAQEYADKFGSNVTVVEKFKGGASTGDYERTVGKALSSKPSYYSQMRKPPGRASTLMGNPDGIVIAGEWVPANAIRFNADGSVSLLTDTGGSEPVMNPVTYRALRYRANSHPPPGPKICAFCGSRRNVEIGHINGKEQDSNPRNLIWTCRACNTRMGIVFKRHGLGRRTRQYNPGAETLGAWMAAVASINGDSIQMKIPDAVALIEATPDARRSRFAKQIWALRRRRGTEHLTGRRSTRREVPF